MGKALKIILYTGTGLFVLCVGLVLIVPGLMDWNQYKGQIVDRVAYELGREFSVSGDISLSVIPQTKFSLQGVHIGNIESASVPHMARVNSVDVEVAFMPLLMGSIQIVRVILVEPTIVLERLADGRSNWIWGESGNTGSRLFSGKFLEDVSLEEFVISAGNLEYLDASSGHRYQIEDIHLSMSAPSLSGPFQFNGVLRAFGSEVMVESISVEVNPQNDVLTRGQISWQGLRLKYSASSNTDAEGVSSWGGALKVYPDGRNRLPASWSKLQEILLGTKDIDPELFEFSSDFSWQGGVLDISESEFRLGEVKGSAVVSLGPNRVSGRVDLGRLNLDRVLNSELSVGDEQIAVELVSKAADLIASLSNRPSLVADVILVADAIQYKGEAIRNVVVDAGINDGVIRLNQCSVRLPGASSLALEGQFYLEQDIPGFLGTAQASSDNLRALLKWLSVELDPLSGERLRRLLFSTKIQGTLASGNLTDIDLQLDTSLIRGGLAYAVSNGRAGLGIGLHVDQLELDAYLPQVSPGEGDVPSDKNPYIALLSAFDADFDIRLDEVTANGIPVSGVILDGLWLHDGLDVREISVQNFLGSSVKFTGMLSDLSLIPSIQGSFSASAKRLGSLARAFPEVNKLPKYILGPIAVELAVQGNFDQITMDGFVEMLESRIALEGSIMDFLNTRTIDMSGEVGIASLAEFGALLSDYEIRLPEIVLGTNIPLTFGADVAGDFPNLDVSAIALLGDGILEAEGTLTQIDQTFEYDLYGDFTHANIGDFLEIFSKEPVPSFLKVDIETEVDWYFNGGPGNFSWEGGIARGDLNITGFGNYEAGESDVSFGVHHPDISTFVSELGVNESDILVDGPIDFSVMLQSGLDGIKVPNLELITPASDLYGDLIVHTSGDEHKLLGSFTSRNLEFSELSALVSALEAGKYDVFNLADEGAGLSFSEPVLDGDDPFSWDDVSADITLEVAKMSGLGQTFENVDAKLDIAPHSVNIAHFSGLWGDGNFNVEGVLAGEPDPSFDIKVSLEEADLTKVLETYDGFGFLSGRVTLQASLTGQGRDKEQRLETLSGHGRITGTAGGTIRGISFQEFFEKSRSLNQVGDFIELVPTILDGGQTLFTGFNGNIKAENGKIRTEDLVFALDEGKATVSGLIDVAGWTQDLEVKTILGDNNLSLPIILYIEGELGAPDVGVRVTELESYLRSVFPDFQKVPEHIQGTVDGLEDINLDQTLEEVISTEAAEDLIERLIEGGSTHELDHVDDNVTPKQSEDIEFRDLLEELLQD